MNVATLIGYLEDMPIDAEVLFEVDVHVGPRDNGHTESYSLHIYTVEQDEDGDVILASG